MHSALLVIDVQEGIFSGHQPPADWPQRVANMQALIAEARANSAPVIFVQHDDEPGSTLAPHTPGWEIDARLNRQPTDVVIRKTACDAFFQTPLQELLGKLGAKELVIGGCWTNYCIDTTCRRAVSLGYNVQLAGDAHACGDSQALSAAQIIAHHNSILDSFSAGPARLRVRPAAQVHFH
jgi:nicotinamidase-related amidase